MDRYLTELAKRLTRIEIPDFSAGASGYFSKPQDTLDSDIFYHGSLGFTVRPEVRQHILHTLFKFWKSRGYQHPEAWTTVWLAGSGISYQWAGDRGNGDLDVIMGIDWPTFYQNNPNWGQTGIDEVTDYIDTELRRKLWPRTAHTNFGHKAFELTYYVNQDASDIRNIHPYAAYDLTSDHWTVKPPQHTAYDQDPGTPSWQATALGDQGMAHAIRDLVVKGIASLPPPRTPQWVTLMERISRQVGHGVELLGSIHYGRRAAFKPGGQGYWDAANWRWQMAKRNGLVAVLGALEHAQEDAMAAVETQTYGAVLPDADTLVIRAAMAHGGGR